jgi:hypothetical protein
MSAISVPEAFTRDLASFTWSPFPPPDATRPVTEADLDALPEVVGRYLRFMGVVGRPRTWSFRVASHGRFRLAPDAAWMPCEAWQYNTRSDIARVFRMRLRMGGLLPVVGHDTYVRGQGRMLVKVLDLFPVADETGTPLAIGELVTWLNDAVLLAPGMLLAGNVRFEGVDDRSFLVSVTDADQTVTAKVHVDFDGAPTSFETTDRFVQDPENPTPTWVRARWSTPVDGWQRIDGRCVAIGGRATWDLKSGPFTYAELRFELDTLRFDLQPELSRTRDAA